MSITVEQRVVDRIYGYVDGLGYLYCVECGGAARPGATRHHSAWPPGHELAAEMETCDGCGRHVLETKPTEVRGDVVIEHVACRIF